MTFYYVDWGDASYPKIRLWDVDRMGGMSGAQSFRACKREIIEHFRGRIKHARAMIKHTKTIKIKDAKENG